MKIFRNRVTTLNISTKTNNLKVAIHTSIIRLSVCLTSLIFANLFYYSTYFCYYFIGPIAFFNTIYESYYTISTNIYLHLQYFQQKKFNFNKINGLQIDHQ